MANVTPTEERVTGMVGVVIYTWANMLLTDVGLAVTAPHFPDKCVQVEGTFGAAGAVTIQGSLYTTTPTWSTLNDANGNALAIATAGPSGVSHIETILENVYQIRPNVLTGDGTTSLTVKLLCSTQARR